MKKSEKRIITGIFVLIFATLVVYNTINGSQWAFDAGAAIVLMLVMYGLNRWLKAGKTGFILFGLALLIHNLGSFDFYSWNYALIGYDNVVHFTSSLVGAYILFNFVVRKLHIKKNQRVANTVVDEHKAIMILLVISLVAMLGVIVEVVEFFGFMYLGEGDGMLFFGTGDADEAGGAYIDTMTDIIVNTLGCIAGVLLFYFTKYKSQPWLRY